MGLEPVQFPDWQVSVCVQKLLSLHAEPLGFFTSAGHANAPPQVSAASHAFAAARQTVEAATGEHTPSSPGSAHESQVPPLHAVLQQ
jgi:hypothetical protein